LKPRIMATLASSENFLATCTRERFIVTSLRGTACLKYELAANDCKSKGDVEDKDELEKKILKKEVNYVIDCRFSPLEKYFAICSSYKQLLVWETADWKLVHTREIPRKPMKLLFSQSEDVVLIADKTGNVYRFDFKTEAPEHLLGHLSVILDMALSSKDKQLVTSDRDGKIRASCYPNCYNIDKFLMAHTSFVTSFAIDKDSKYLVSIDGEKQIFLWDLPSGHFLDNIKIDIEGELIPRKVCMDQMLRTYVLVDGSKFVFRFEIKEEKIKSLGKIALEHIPLDLLCDGQDIILLQQSIDHPVLCYHINEEREHARLEKSSRLSGLDEIRQFVRDPMNVEPWKCSGWQDDDN